MNYRFPTAVSEGRPSSPDTGDESSMVSQRIVEYRLAGREWFSYHFTAQERQLIANGCSPTAEVEMLQGFKQFMLRGNVLDLAVAVVMGAAFGAVVTALVKDLITPLIAAIVGKPDFSAIQFTVHGSRFPIGDFINAIVSFILIGAAVYFFIVLPVNKLIARMRRGEAPPDPTTKKCPECLSDVPIAARRCAFCTTSLTQNVSANAPPPSTRSRSR